MSRPRVTEMISEDIKNMGSRGVSLQRRLLLFFLLFLAVVMSGTALILLLSGALSAGHAETSAWLRNEISHLSEDVSEEFGELSDDGAALAEGLSSYLDGQLKSGGVRPDGIQSRPEILTGLLAGSFDSLEASLEKSRASGAFLILNATTNPSPAAAGRSRAGLYLKSAEPDTGGAEGRRLAYLRGPMAVAREKGLPLLPQWREEIEAYDSGMFETAKNAAGGSVPVLSRLCFWTSDFALEGGNIPSVFLCVPILTKDKTVIGMCGFSISGQLFKTRYSPPDETYARVCSMIAPMTEDGRLDASGALLAGSYPAERRALAGALTVRDDTLDEFLAADGTEYTGVFEEISLHPADSAFAGRRWALAVMMPKEDFTAFVSERSGRVIGLMAFFFILCLLAAVVLTRRYLSPVLKALRMIRESGAQEYGRTRIPEIDDLIEFLSGQDSARGKSAQASEAKPASSTMYDAFIKKIGALSPAERAVFNLYLEGCDARQIADALCLSINTIKTHNKRIYMKLDVTSRKELMVYAQMMKERGAVRDRG